MAIDVLARAVADALPVTRRADGVPGPPQGSWTYEDYLATPDDGRRYEVIEGVLYVSPAPAPRHQRRLLRLCHRLMLKIDAERLGELFIAPVDVVMPGAAPVQPDALFIGRDNPAIVDETKNITGVPDLVIEVASPSTAGYDRREKQNAYARAGAPEYWIVDSSAVAIEPLLLDPATRAYVSLGVFTGSSGVPSRALPGLTDTVDDLLGEPRPGRAGRRAAR